MSHITESFVYSPGKDVTDKQIITYMSGERYTRMVLECGYSEHRLQGIKVLRTSVFASEEAAEEYIRRERRGYDLVVPFYEATAKPKTKKIQELEERVAKLQKQRAEYADKHTLASYKSATVGCAACGSKLAIAPLVKRYGARVHMCPVCNGELWSATTQQGLASLDARIKEAQKALNAAVKQNVVKSPKVSWLMVADIHV